MRDITLEDTFYHTFPTRAFDTQLPFTLAGSPVLSVKEGGNATPITAGVSVSVDVASVTGLNEATIVATAANGYEVGKSYAIYISTGTVDGDNVAGEVVGEFTIAASAAAVDLANATDGLGALKTLLDAIPTTAMRGTDGALTDKAGFSLSTAGILAVWHQALSAVVTAGSVGKLIKDEITAARMAVLTDWIDGGRLDLLLDAVNTTTPPTVGQIQTELEEDGASLLDTIRDDLANGTDGLSALKALIDALPQNKTGYSLSAAGTLAIWHEAVANIVTASTIGKLLKDEITAARMATLTDWIDGGRLDLLLDATKAVTDTLGYEHGAIWIDTVNGAAGTVDYVNGTVDNPVNSIADANTLAASLGISQFEMAPNSSITFAAAQTNQVFRGHKWTLALGGQNVAGSIFIGAAVSGVMAGTGVLQKFVDCIMLATSVIKGTIFVECQIADTITVVEAGEFLFRGCASSVAGAGAPTFDFGAAIAASNLSVRRHSGGWNIENMGAGAGVYNATFEGHGQIIWKASCSATSNASIRGHWRITDEASGAVTETKDDITADVDAVLGDTNELQVDDVPGLIAALNDPTSAAIVTAILAAVVEGTTTLQQSLALSNAASASKLSGAATPTNVLRDLADTIDRISATVDSNGNRTAIARSYSDM